MLNKITLHWTAGRNIPNAEEMKHYHYLIDANGLLYKGFYAPEDNLNCVDGKYAQHCGGGNTNNIGVAFCGCSVPKGIPVKDTAYPLTRKQLEKGFELCAQLCKKYNIPIDKAHVFTHYEFGLAHPKTSSAGKIDITYMHPFPKENKNTCGDFIRNKIKWYYAKNT
jgi:N-acetyl-anhydromuramyl-L-alanine amidase AmpD